VSDRVPKAVLKCGKRFSGQHGILQIDMTCIDTGVNYANPHSRAGGHLPGPFQSQLPYPVLRLSGDLLMWSCRSRNPYRKYTEDGRGANNHRERGHDPDIT
jgi:hypothetical protein